MKRERTHIARGNDSFAAKYTCLCGKPRHKFSIAIQERLDAMSSKPQIT